MRHGRNCVSSKKPILAANRFRSMCEGNLFLSRLSGLKKKFSKKEYEEEADQVVSLFLLAYKVG